MLRADSAGARRPVGLATLTFERWRSRNFFCFARDLIGQLLESAVLFENWKINLAGSVFGWSGRIRNYTPEF